MTFNKPKEFTFQQISDKSRVGLRTIKRYAAGGNVTLRNAEAINKAVSELRANGGVKVQDHIVPRHQQEFFFPKNLFRQNLFWSSPTSKSRNIDGVIEAYVKSPNIYDISLLVRLFGADRVMDVAQDTYAKVLKQYSMSPKKMGTLPEFQAVERMVKYVSSVKSSDD